MLICTHSSFVLHLLFSVDWQNGTWHTYTELEVAMPTVKEPFLLMAKLIYYYSKGREILCNFLEIL